DGEDADLATSGLDRRRATRRPAATGCGLTLDTAPHPGRFLFQQAPDGKNCNLVAESQKEADCNQPKQN
ncbi:hypothetical protein ACK0NM_31420, partial [Pseudomonas aeruginosa]|uniref:hypothetical protein n=1 Tax=Pseudomonas aeruginosa TaxID=287 RepID=UPI0039081BA1